MVIVPTPEDANVVLARERADAVRKEEEAKIARQKADEEALKDAAMLRFKKRRASEDPGAARKRRERVLEDEISNANATMKRWVQECLARDERRLRLLEKGVLRFQVHNPYSKAFHSRLSHILSSYGATVAVSEKPVPTATDDTKARIGVDTQPPEGTVPATTKPVAPQAVEDGGCDATAALEDSTPARPAEPVPMLDDVGAAPAPPTKAEDTDAAAVASEQPGAQDASATPAAPDPAADEAMAQDAVPNTGMASMGEEAAPDGEIAVAKPTDGEVESAAAEPGMSAGAKAEGDAAGEVAQIGAPSGEATAAKPVDGEAVPAVPDPDISAGVEADGAAAEKATAAPDVGVGEEAVGAADGNTAEDAVTTVEKESANDSTPAAVKSGSAAKASPAEIALVATPNGKASMGEIAIAATPNDKGAVLSHALAKADVPLYRFFITFNAAAFETFMRIHPDVVEPPVIKLRDYVAEFVRKVDVETMRLKDLYESLEKKFGPMRRATLERSKLFVSEAIAREAANAKRNIGANTHLKDKNAQPLARFGGAVVNSEVKRARIETPEDVRWAASYLAPLGFRENGEAIVRLSAPLAAPVLEGLKDLEELSGFRAILKDTSIGKVVNSFRTHPNPETQRAAKALLAGWKATCERKAKASAKNKDRQAASNRGS
eukprot:NODE_1248_length_2548_cov_6.370095.p1 GENE.NODE_1248_length_2548_cov_6.370095~~NODE_1248_length_2548_cov_6.370095.p1  ORF type:complete len:664 (-),score=188.60 NODE_1248_length_2548_cov_6.370095:318-2309(-)